MDTFNNEQSAIPDEIISHEIRCLNNSLLKNLLLTSFTNNNFDENTTILCPFEKPSGVIRWYSNTKISLVKNLSTDTKVEFTIPDGFFLLKSSVYVQKLPQLSIKESFIGKYRMRWCRDILLVSTKTCSLICKNTSIVSYDDMYLLDKAQWNVPEGYRKKFNYNIGNRKNLIKWTTFLPETLLNTQHPWFYNLHPGMAFPLYKLSSDKTLNHSFTLRNNISDLLQVQEFVNGKWVTLTKKQLSPVLDKILNNERESSGRHRLPAPEMYAELSNTTDDLHNKRNEEDIYYIQDIIHSSSSEPMKYGQSKKIGLPYKDMILKASYFKACNLNSLEYNNYSNFTSNLKSCKKGYSPIDTISVDYNKGSTVKMPTTKAELLSGSFVYQSFISVPKLPGYHVYSPVCDNTEPFIDAGPSLNCDINYMFILANPTEEKNQESKCEYSLIVRSEVIKIIQFKDGGIISATKNLDIK